MIDRKLNKIREGKDMLHKLISISAQMDYTDDQIIKDKLAALWAEFKLLSSQIEQITWALNSNKEHLRYVARIYVVPEVYQRSEDEQVLLKNLLKKVVQDCHEVIQISQSIRKGFEMQLRTIYADINPKKGTMTIVPNGSQQKKQHIEIGTTIAKNYEKKEISFVENIRKDLKQENYNDDNEKGEEAIQKLSYEPINSSSSSSSAPITTTNINSDHMKT